MQKNQRLLYNQGSAKMRLNNIHLPLMYSDNANKQEWVILCLSSQHQRG